MNKNRIKQLQSAISQPLFIKKKENLFYLTGQRFMQGFLLVRKNHVVFFGDGLEKVEGIKKTDRLKYIGKYLGSSKKIILEEAIKSIFILHASEIDRLKVDCILPE